MFSPEDEIFLSNAADGIRQTVENLHKYGTSPSSSKPSDYFIAGIGLRDMVLNGKGYTAYAIEHFCMNGTGGSGKNNVGWDDLYSTSIYAIPDYSSFMSKDGKMVVHHYWNSASIDTYLEACGEDEIKKIFFYENNLYISPEQFDLLKKWAGK